MEIQISGKSLNDFGYVLEQIRKLKDVLQSLQWWLIENHCEFYYMEDNVYEEYCKNPESEVNKNRKKGKGDFLPERDCPKCPLYMKRFSNKQEIEQKEI